MKSLMQLEKEALEAHQRAALKRQEEEKERDERRAKEVERISNDAIAKLSEITNVDPQELKETIEFSTAGWYWNDDTPNGLTAVIKLKDHFDIRFNVIYTASGKLYGFGDFTTYYQGQRFEYTSLGKALAKAALNYEAWQKELAQEKSKKAEEPPAKTSATAALIVIAKKLSDIVKGGVHTYGL